MIPRLTPRFFGFQVFFIPGYWFQNSWRGMRPLDPRMKRLMDWFKRGGRRQQMLQMKGFRSPFLLHGSWCHVVSCGLMVSWSWRKVSEVFEYWISRGSLSKALPTHLLKQSCSHMIYATHKRAFLWHLPLINRTCKDEEGTLDLPSFPTPIWI